MIESIMEYNSFGSTFINHKSTILSLFFFIFSILYHQTGHTFPVNQDKNLEHATQPKSTATVNSLLVMIFYFLLFYKRDVYELSSTNLP